MTLNDKQINFDINRNNLFNLTAKQFDTTGSRSFTFRLLKNSIPFDLTGLYVKVGGKKPDGKDIFNSCTIKDAKKGIVELELTTQMQVVAGILNLELIILKEETRLSTIPFEIQIIKSATCYSEVQSSDEFGALQEAIRKTDNVYDKQEIDNFIWNMKNMGQDVKEALTGGSVAVVGENAVNTINLCDISVTEEKISKDLNWKINESLNGKIAIKFLNKLHFKSGYIKSSDFGIKETDAHYVFSDFYEIKEIKEIKYELRGQKEVYILSFYDENKKPIRGVTTDLDYNELTKGVITVPEKSKYLRVCFAQTIDTGIKTDNNISYLSNTNERIENMTKSIENNKENLEIKTSVNLTDCAKDYGFIGLNGEIANMGDENWVYSSFIEVLEGYNLKCKLFGDPRIASISYFNKNKTFIRCEKAENINKAIIIDTILDDNIKFIRVCFASKNNPDHGNESIIEFYNLKKLKDYVEELDIKVKKMETQYSFTTIVNKPFDFKLTEADIFGDSITKGCINFTDTTQHNWVNLFKEKVGFSKVYNKGIGGLCLTSVAREDVNLVNEIKKTNIGSKFIFIAIGTNDYGLKAKIGEPDSLNMKEMYGAMNILCEHLKEKYSDREIIFILPINRVLKPEGQPLSLDDYREVIFNKCLEFGFNVVDGSKFGFPEDECYNATKLFGDGLHPTEFGYGLYARALSNALL